MTTKRLIDQTRIRKVPAKFSWVDHRLVQDRHLEDCSHPAAALYLFLVTVSDAQGLSYYSDASIMQRLSMSHDQLLQARLNLEQLRLIAYKKPLYQVLALDCDETRRVTTSATSDGPLSIADILQTIAGGVS